MQTKTTVALFAIVAATLAFVAVAPSLLSSASARITQENTCSNHNGQVIGSSCPGSSAGPGQGHTQTTTCNHNPSGTTSCPPGQNR